MICSRRLTKNGPDATTERARALLHKRCKRRIDFARRACIQHREPPAERARGVLRASDLPLAFLIVRIREQDDTVCGGSDL